MGHNWGIKSIGHLNLLLLQIIYTLWCIDPIYYLFLIYPIDSAQEWAAIRAATVEPDQISTFGLRLKWSHMELYTKLDLVRVKVDGPPQAKKGRKPINSKRARGWAHMVEIFNQGPASKLLPTHNATTHAYLLLLLLCCHPTQPRSPHPTVLFNR